MKVNLNLIRPLALLVTAAGGVPQASAATTAQDCVEGFNALNFSPIDFTSHAAAFRSDSVIIDVTGPDEGYYQGLQVHTANVMFMSGLSPYTRKNEQSARDVTLQGLSGDTCIFRAYGKYTWHPAHLVEQNPPTIEAALMGKYYYNAAKDYITRADIYPPAPFLGYYFNTLNTPGVKGFICNTLRSVCNMDVGDDNACQSYLAGLPVDLGLPTINSYGLLAMNAVFAHFDPAGCNQISLEEIDDPLANITCPGSNWLKPGPGVLANVTQFDEFCADHGNQYPFDDDDLDGYEAFGNDHGIDVASGYTTRDAVPRNACGIDGDCIGIKKCKNPNKCKCKDLKCRKKKRDCLSRGTEDEKKHWNCKHGKTCVAKTNPSGGTWKWGKCE